MSLAGSGAVAIWHDIAGEGREPFYAWHGREHMPERVGIPGFRRGRRYVAVHGAPEFFNLYETASPATVAGADYLARLNAPTPWTLATVPHFRNVARALCEVAASAGDGQGGLIATFRYAVAAGMEAQHRLRMLARIDAFAEQSGIAGLHLLVADLAASSVATAERQARAGGTQVPAWIVLAEAWGDEQSFVDWTEGFACGDAFREAQAVPEHAVYRLQNSRDRLAEAFD